MRSRAVNSTEVARRAGVSRTTVSFVLNGRDDMERIPLATRERVLQAAEDLGYSPNHLARVLQSGRSYLISLLIRRVHPAFFSRSIAEFQSILQGSGYDLRVQETASWTAEHWKEAAADRWPVDGVIVIESVDSVAHFVEATNGRVPVVNVGAVVDTTVDHVGIDLHSGTVEAVRHLQATGRSRIAYLISPFAKNTSRGMAYTEMVTQAGKSPLFITTDPLWGASERALGMQAMAGFLQTAGNEIDALVCFNDEFAIGALRAIRERGLRVPEDIALVGCDDIEEAVYHAPSLSTLHYPYEEAARLAWAMLLRRIDDPDLPTQTAVIPSTLVIRQSSAVPAAIGS